MIVRASVLSALAASAACTETGAHPLTWAPFDPGNVCAVQRDVFGPYCVSCHDGSAESPDLRGSALADLPGLIGAYGLPIVVPNDPDASFIVEKVVGPDADHGDKMPQGSSMPQSAIDALIAWVASGAPPCAGDSEDIIVGGPVDFGGPFGDFTAKQPGWTARGECASAQWWSIEGNEGSEEMHPGRDCVDCHTREDGPSFAYAGTVYPTLDDSDDCRGVPGVNVEILDELGAVVHRTTSNEAGNFFVEGRFHDGYRARLTYQGRTREMGTMVFGTRGCNTCHASVGNNDAPGRIVAP